MLPTSPRRLTVVEQLITRSRLPYSLGSLALSLIMGLPGLLLIGLLDTGDITIAAQRVFTPYTNRPAWTGILDPLVNTAIIFYMLLTIRFMRNKLATAETQLGSLTTDGGTSLHWIFHHVSSTRAQLATSLLLFISITLLPQTYPGSTNLTPTSPQAITAALIITAIFYVTVGTFVWVYISTLWGLHRFGKQPLRLKHYQEDRLLGTGAIGSLSLTLAISYYAVIGPVTFESLVLSPDPTGYATLFPLVLLGGIMFFLPQVSLHRQMQTTKEHEEQRVRAQLSQLTLQDKQKDSNRMEDLPHQVDRLIQLEMLRLNEKRLQEVPSWPFDKKTLEYFAAIFLSILTALLTRLLLAALNL